MKKTILIIEDNEQNLYLETFMLEKNGYTVHAERDGRKGLARAVDIKPDLILLDIQLPGMDGYSVARAIKAERDLARIPIVAVTSYAMPGDREKAIEAGCTGYIEKPIDPESFIGEIGRIAQGGCP